MLWNDPSFRGKEINNTLVRCKPVVLISLYTLSENVFIKNALKRDTAVIREQMYLEESDSFFLSGCIKGNN